MSKIKCSACSDSHDKGGEAQPGQRDDSYVCAKCQRERDKEAIAAAEPTVVVTPES